MKSPELGKVEALARANAAWRDWQDFLNRESGAERGDERGTDGWTLAEAVAHIARWQEWAVERIGQARSGVALGELPVDEMNARWAAEDANVGYQGAMRRLDRAWAALQATAESVPEGSWNGAVERVLAANTWEHYEEHKAWRPDSATLSH